MKLFKTLAIATTLLLAVSCISYARTTFHRTTECKNNNLVTYQVVDFDFETNLNNAFKYEAMPVFESHSFVVVPNVKTYSVPVVVPVAVLPDKNVDNKFYGRQCLYKNFLVKNYRNFKTGNFVGSNYSEFARMRI